MSTRKRIRSNQRRCRAGRAQLLLLRTIDVPLCADGTSKALVLEERTGGGDETFDHSSSAR